MAYAIGIDTGGTYTDCVIFELKTQKVIAKTKALTTYEDLTIGIRNCIGTMDLINVADIEMVSLSTTLATNAIVEGRGGSVGVLLIGHEPIDTLPTNYWGVIKGGHDLKGREKETLDLAEARTILENFRGQVDALAISSFASVRNPEHELKIKELVKEIMEVPVVCGHQLTTSLGFYERTVTATLNAKLIPIIANLINSVKQVLREKGITAQLMVVKGDGTLMSESVALEKPIETILSGPAASIVGATYLTDSPQALVIDIGGTTSDIAILEGGIPRLNNEGARVGGWLTRVQAADINTFGLGGDSYIRLDNYGNLLVGPQKVWPLSVLGSKFPYLLEELQLQQENLRQIKNLNATDCYMLVKENPEMENLTSVEKGAIEVLRSGAHSLFYIANILKKNPYSLDLQPLVEKGILAKGALTPTDLFHVKGIYEKWSKESATLGVNILARVMGKRLQEFMVFAEELFVQKLSLAIIETMLNIEGAPRATTENLENNYFINKMLKPRKDHIFQSELKVNIPIIAIGAPAKAFMPQVAHQLRTSIITPEDGDVANAIGAAVGKVMEKVKILINPSPDGYSLYSQFEKREFTDLEDAKAYGLKLAKEQATLTVERSGVTNYQISESCEDRFANGSTGTYLETKIEVTVLGRPKW